jgi:hypothetical protein
MCRMLSQHTAPGLPPRLGRGFALSSLSADDAHYYRDRLAGVIRYLGHHRPWLLKVRTRACFYFYLFEHAFQVPH